MQLKFTREEDFRQERDFGGKISATFEFLGAHWRPLGKCLLYFVLPVALLMGVGVGMLTNGIWNMASLARQNGNVAEQYGSGNAFGPAYFSGLGPAMLGGLAAFLMLLSTVYAYVRILLTEQPATAPTPAQVWQQIRLRLGRMLLAFGFLFGLYLVVAALFAGIIGLGAMALGNSVFLIFLVVFPLLIYVMIPLSLYFPSLWMEDCGVLTALQRCFALVRGHWWASLGLLMVAGIIQSMLSLVFVLPQYAVMFGKMLKIPGLDSDALGIAAQCFYASGIIFTYSVSLLAILFQYFNLVELKDGLGLRNLVSGLGSSPVPVAYNQAYRPDEEGEY